MSPINCEDGCWVGLEQESDPDSLGFGCPRYLQCKVSGFGGFCLVFSILGLTVEDICAMLKRFMGLVRTVRGSVLKVQGFSLGCFGKKVLKRLVGCRRLHG